MSYSTKPFVSIAAPRLRILCFTSLFTCCGLFADDTAVTSSETDDKPSVHSQSVEQLNSGADAEKEFPIRLDLFPQDSRHVQLQWALKEPQQINNYLIQKGIVVRTDEKEREFRWEDVQILDGATSQWTLRVFADHSTNEFLRVVAQPKDGEALFSQPALITSVPAIPATALVRLNLDRMEYNRVQISWNPPASAENSAAEIERAHSSLGPWRVVGRVSPGGRIFQDRFLEPDTEYHYRVRGSHGKVSWQSEILRLRTPRR